MEIDPDDGVSDKIKKFGARLMEMAAPYGVKTIAIGSLPAREAATLLPFREQSPKPLKLFLMRGRLSHTTHFFLKSSVDDEISHVVCKTPASRDEAIARAGEGLAFFIGGNESAGERQGVIFFGTAPSREDSYGRVLALIADYACARFMMILSALPTRPLSERQLEVLSWAAEGKTDQEIAMILGLSDHTIDKYMRQIKEALGAVNRTAAIVAAMRSGLIA